MTGVQTCALPICQFAAALKLYQINEHKGNEAMPGRLTNLFDEYLDNKKVFLCPADVFKGKQGGKPDVVDDEDWEHATDERVELGCKADSSYFYEFSEVECGWGFEGHLNATIEQITGDASATAASWNQVKFYQMRHGDVSNGNQPYPRTRFPTVRCFWHAADADDNANPKNILNLSFTGNVFLSGPKWEDTAGD